LADWQKPLVELLARSFVDTNGKWDSEAYKKFLNDCAGDASFLNAVDFRTVSFVSFLNLAVLAGVFVIITLTLSKFQGKLYTYSFIILSIAMTASGIQNTSVIKSEYTAAVESGTMNEVEIEPLFHLSKNARNVVVFMLDRAESQFVEEMFTESPDFYDTFTGFTFYPNTVSFNGHTMMGAPLIFGGYEYQPFEMNRRKDELLYKKTNEAILMLPRIFTEQADFNAVITDPSWANYSQYADLSITEPYEKISGFQTIGKYSRKWYKNHSSGQTLDNTDDLLKHNLFIFSIFRSSPVVLREVIYLKGKYWNSNAKQLSYMNVINNLAPLEFLPELTNFTDSAEGTYVCMVNELTHSSTFMQAPDYTPSAEITDYGTSRFNKQSAYHTNMAAFKRDAGWINLLKKNGVYDNTRIILVADHGRTTYEDCMEKDSELDNKIAGDRYRGRGHFHPLLMVKDFNARERLKTDMTFMTNGDVPSLAVKGIVSSPVNPFTGKEVPSDTQEIKKNGVTVTSSDIHQAWLYRDEYTYKIRDDQWWHVKDDVFKASSWSQEIHQD
ncbi:MAG: hypothetical protein J6Y93_06960, partial [Treponema sp.]|nr:hypothetical protein [Treponema sp.]